MDVDEFCVAIWPRLVWSLTSYTGDAGLAEEFAQESLVRLLSHWDRVSKMDAPTMWVFRTGLNLAKSGWRRRRAEARAYQRLVDVTPRDARGADPADLMALRAEIARLPERQRAAVVLRYHGDLSVAETAKVMRCATGTVTALTSQGLARLRERLDDPTPSEVAEP